MWRPIRSLVLAGLPLATLLGAAPALATDPPAPTGSAIAVTTELTGAGQDFKQTLTYAYKAYWDEIFDYPIEQDEKGNLVPGYATSWTASSDGLTWTFVIRQGVKFHNGDTLTAKDVAWSWSRLIFDADSKHTLTAYRDAMDSITADGDNVIVKTKTPQSLLPLWFAKVEGNLGGTALDEAYYEKVGAAEAASHPIGTGPYKFVSQNGEQSVQLTAFDDPTRSDWQKSRTPGIKDLTILAVPEASTRLGLLKTGAADLVPLSIASLDDIKNDPNIHTITVPSTNYSGMWCVGFTLNDQSACNDERIREALSISIDRDTIGKALYRGQAIPSGGWYGGPGSFGYPDDMQLPAFDPDKATKLLADAGYGPSHPLKVQIVAYDDDVDFPMMPTLAEAIVGYYTAIGIDATIQTSDWTAQKDMLVKGKYPGQPNNPAVTPVTLFLRGMDNRYYFPAEQIGAYTANGRLGLALWDNKKLPQQDQMLTAVSDAFDLKKQEQLFGDYYKWMEANFNHIPLLASSTVFGVSSKIKSWDPVAGKPFIHNLRTLVPSN